MKKIRKYSAAVFFLTFILFSFSCDKEVSVSPPDPPVHTGYLFIDSNPRGAFIFLNGKNTGNRTPDSLCWLEGKYDSITLKYPLYKDTTFVIKIEEDVRKDIFIDYYSNPLMYGKIFCVTEPEKAAVYLDGQNTGKFTPTALENLIPGSHKVKYFYPGCREDSFEVVVESNTTKYITRKLTDTTIWVTYNKSTSGIPVENLSAILIDRNDVKWIGTLGEGVLRFDGTTFRSYNSANSSLPNNFITAMAFDGADLWAGTKEGLAVMRGGSWTAYKTDNSILPENYITSICIDKNGTKWIGTRKGLVRIEGTQWKLFDNLNSGLPNSEVQAVAADGGGKLWLGIGMFGLVSYDGTNWSMFTKENTALPGRDVTALAAGQLSEGVWAGFLRTLPRGSDEGGLAVMENNVWHNSYSTLPSRSIRSIKIKNNIRWVCTDWGLLKFSSASAWRVMNTGNTLLPSNNIAAVDQDSRGVVWIATAFSGLVKYKMMLDKN